MHDVLALENVLTLCNHHIKLSIHQFTSICVLGKVYWLWQSFQTVLSSKMNQMWMHIL